MIYNNLLLANLAIESVLIIFMIFLVLTTSDIIKDQQLPEQQKNNTKWVWCLRLYKLNQGQQKEPKKLWWMVEGYEMFNKNRERHNECEEVMEPTHKEG